MKNKTASQLSLFQTSTTDIIYKNLQAFQLPKSYFKQMEDLVNGKISELSLVCCHAECDVCTVTIKKCLKKIREEIESIR